MCAIKFKSIMGNTVFNEIRKFESMKKAIDFIYLNNKNFDAGKSKYFYSCVEFVVENDSKKMKDLDKFENVAGA